MSNRQNGRDNPKPSYEERSQRSGHQETVQRRAQEHGRDRRTARAEMCGWLDEVPRFGRSGAVLLCVVALIRHSALCCPRTWATSVYRFWVTDSFLLQKGWSPGTQCVTKCDHSKPKPSELAYRKGDMLTIIEAGVGKGVYRAQHNKTGEQGLISASNVREREAIRVDPSLSLMPWFHGKISGPEAVNKLQPIEDGLFLVRESIRHPGDYVLCVIVGQEVIHYRVIYKDNKLTIDNSKFFYNLIDMIEFYTKNQGALATTLQKPKEKAGAKSAEVELSKAGWLLDIDKLALGERIGEGEFGAVYMGHYMGQRVAVKDIKCDVTAQAFLEETAVMTKLQHRNLVRLHGVILHNGLHIVTEFMDKHQVKNRGQSAMCYKDHMKTEC
ncbi:hypothetical protein Z043_116176 [Scleropages formosus]|uniref:Tyrosine-protein kinase n=1 Tax=Scleropages formosus TaxID=113540 RepID=A0A0P7TVN3_SCLFO|nr:hypothetical protein Z043_116176 [Scleropages formosus]